MESKKAFFTNIRQLIAEDDLSSAIQQLRILLENSAQLDEIIQQSTRLERIYKQIRLGVVSQEEANLTQNQISQGLLDFLREVEEQSEAPNIQAEVEKAISVVNSKNVLVDSPITTEGDVHIGDKNTTIIIQKDANDKKLQKKAFNEQLTKTLTEAIAPHCIPGQKLLKYVSSKPGWENQENISSKAKEIIAYSFVGVIGIQLSKLMAIGKEAFSETKQRKYIKKCLQIVKISLDLVNFSLLSGLWDTQQQSACEISEHQSEILSHRFDNAFEQSIEEQFALLQVLHQVLIANKRVFPLTELENFTTQLQTDSDFHQLCQKLQALNHRWDKDQCTLPDCFEAETQLGSFLQNFAFLVKYRMVSIKQIGYQQTRNAQPNYLHRYIALGIDSKANIDAEKINYSRETTHTDAVLIYKGDNYQDNINLYPFVIDYNALTFEHGSKICYYTSKTMEDDSLEYLFLEDNSSINIETEDILIPGADLNTLMKDKEKRETLNLNNVIAGFKEARKSILKEEITLDDL